MRQARPSESGEGLVAHPCNGTIAGQSGLGGSESLGERRLGGGAGRNDLNRH